MKHFLKNTFYYLFIIILWSCSSDNAIDPEIKEDPVNATTWLLYNENVFTLEETNNTLTLSLDQNALWYENNSGGLAYQNITGDFTISGKVLVRTKNDDTISPECNICLGGIMARNPDNTNGENYVHLVSGNTPSSGSGNILGVEHKSTTSSASIFTTEQDGISDHELKIERIGSNFLMSYKNIGATDWILIQTYNRPDLPETLQVGLNIYTAETGTTADLKIIYEDIIIN